MNQFVSQKWDVPQREFVYRIWESDPEMDGKEKWEITRHEICKKTPSRIYAHCAPYLGQEYDRMKSKSVFEIARKEIEQLGRSWVFLMQANFYLSEAAARAAIPKRVQLEPAQATYFGLSTGVTLKELQLVYFQLAHRLDPVRGGSAEAFSVLEAQYQAALRTLRK